MTEQNKRLAKEKKLAKMVIRKMKKFAKKQIKVRRDEEKKRNPVKKRVSKSKKDVIEVVNVGDLVKVCIVVG